MRSDPHIFSVSPKASARQHECEDPSTGWIWFSVMLVVLMTVACLLIVQFEMGALDKSRPLDKDARVRGAVSASNLEPLVRFPPPNLQINPRDDLAALRANEMEQLNTYGWVDRSNGIVRLPIDRAMELVLQRGLPTRASNAPAKTGPSSFELIQQRSQQR